jgi:serine/threonine-protein kinase HipA
MIFKQINALCIKYCNGNQTFSVGKLVLQDRKIWFEYDPDFLTRGFELSPFKLPLKPGLITCEDRVFEGLFGVFNDSLPDGWGRLLLDRKLSKLGLNPHILTPLDRLQYVGKRGMGALQYEPEIEDLQQLEKLESLDLIAQECLGVLENDEDDCVDKLLMMNGSSVGARPKILVTLISNQEKFKPTENHTHTKHNDWIVKFRSSHVDPKDMGSIEYAYHLMASSAGLELPQARLFSSKKGSGYFGVKRFDRESDHFVHMHTISGLLNADHRIPSLDYQTIIKATHLLTKDLKQSEKQFRHAVFNVLSYNRDDHSKNFSFLMNHKGKWRVSPAYDLTFSSGPAGEHCTTVMGEGKNPRREHFLKLAQTSSIEQKTALEIIDQVATAVSQWRDFAKKSDVSKRSCEAIAKVLDHYNF